MASTQSKLMEKDNAHFVWMTLVLSKTSNFMETNATPLEKFFCNVTTSWLITKSSPTPQQILPQKKLKNFTENEFALDSERCSISSHFQQPQKTNASKDELHSSK